MMRFVLFDDKNSLLHIEPLSATRESMESNQIKNRKQNTYKYVYGRG